MPPAIPPPARPKHLLEGAEAPTWWASIDRRRAAVAVGMSMLALPVVVLDNLPDRSSAEAVETGRAPTEGEPTGAVVVTIPRAVDTTAPTTTTPPPPTTTTTAPPTPTTARAVATATAPTTTARPATTTTTTTAPPPATTAPPAPPPTGNTESGGATWYRHAPGECAHKTIAMGTVVTVANQANGATATCTVSDRGPYTAGRIIDLDATVFEQLAPLGAGVIQVTITW